METFSPGVQVIEPGKSSKSLQNQKQKTSSDAFYRSLAFGTAGLRGAIGVGTNRMNVYVVAQAAGTWITSTLTIKSPWLSCGILASGGFPERLQLAFWQLGIRVYDLPTY